MSPDPGIREVHGVCPLDCPDTCGWVVTVQDGRAIKLVAIARIRTREARSA